MRSLFLTPDSLNLSSQNTSHNQAQAQAQVDRNPNAKQHNVFQCHLTFGAEYHLITLLKFKQYIKTLTENNNKYFHFKANV